MIAKNFVNNYFFEWKLARVPTPILITNFIFQRLLRINSSVPFPVHYTSRVIGFKKLKLKKPMVIKATNELNDAI